MKVILHEKTNENITFYPNAYIFVVCNQKSI
jgi:hypothetical protein